MDRLTLRWRGFLGDNLGPGRPEEMEALVLGGTFCVVAALKFLPFLGEVPGPCLRLGSRILTVEVELVWRVCWNWCALGGKRKLIVSLALVLVLMYVNFVVRVG